MLILSFYNALQGALAFEMTLNVSSAVCSRAIIINSSSVGLKSFTPQDSYTSRIYFLLCIFVAGYEPHAILNILDILVLPYIHRIVIYNTVL
jgi:hypothetical protein